MNAGVAGETDVSVRNLRTEDLDNPLGIDVRVPQLGWQITARRRNSRQSAYQIQVAEDGGSFGDGAELLWDSGKVASARCIGVPYGGPATRTRQRYIWRVRVWDQDDRSSTWSEPAWWEMGLLEEAAWTADWIEPDGEEDPEAFKPCPFLRREFVLDQPVASARLYITAHGLYEAWLNGQRVGDQVFTPGYTAYDRRLQYQVYDVTDLVQEGANALGAILGDGWYRGRVYIAGNRNVYGDRLGLLAQLVIETLDGSEVVVRTDAHWKASTGPILKSDMRDGETYDARLEMPGWNRSGFDDGAWAGVRTPSHSKNHLVASMGVPVRRKEHFSPKAILRTPKGETVVDFGQNLAGVVRMTVRGPRGTTVHLHHGETLDKDGNFTTAHLFVRPPKEGKTPPFQEVHYTLRGEDEETYEPRFTVHGFRYVKIEGYPGQPKPEDFSSIAIYSDMPTTGTFACSDPLINQLHHNTEWSMKSNFLDLPTDCPTRERAGWTGDAQIFTPSVSFLADTRAFFRKWLHELALEQFPDGKVGNFVPNPYRRLRGGMAGLLKRLDGSAGWGDAATIIPWSLYQIYGDRRVLEDQYESMKAWVDFQRAQAKRTNWSKRLSPRHWFDRETRRRQRYIWDTGYHWGEWLEPGRGGPIPMATDMAQRLLFGSAVVATAYFVRSARIVAKTAELLGRQEEAETYGDLADKVKAAYVEAFIAEDGRIKPDKQASYVRALAFDLVPEALKPAVVDHLVRLVRESDTHIGTGFLSTPFLCHVLAENGRLDVAYELLTQTTIPSWLYAVTKGATTIWESWEGIAEDGTPQLSLNHYSPGAVIEFLHRKVAGIDAVEPGYRRIAIHPRPGGGLTSAKASYASAYGLIASAWAIEDGRMRLDVTVPANTEAVVRLPGGDPDAVSESDRLLSEADGVLSIVRIGSDTQCELGSGTYHFDYPIA